MAYLEAQSLSDESKEQLLKAKESLCLAIESLIMAARFAGDRNVELSDAIRQFYHPLQKTLLPDLRTLIVNNGIIVTQIQSTPEPQLATDH